MQHRHFQELLDCTPIIKATVINIHHFFFSSCSPASVCFLQLPFPRSADWGLFIIVKPRRLRGATRSRFRSAERRASGVPGFLSASLFISVKNQESDAEAWSASFFFPSFPVKMSVITVFNSTSPHSRLSSSSSSFFVPPTLSALLSSSSLCLFLLHANVCPGRDAAPTDARRAGRLKEGWSIYQLLLLINLLLALLLHIFDCCISVIFMSKCFICVFIWIFFKHLDQLF